MVNKKLQEFLDSCPKEFTWREDVKWRKENRFWVSSSRQIALLILRTIRERKINKVELSKMTGISYYHIQRILKGNTNLTLRTVRKFEIALGIQIMTINIYKK